MQFCHCPNSPVARNGSPMAGWPARCSRCIGFLLRLSPPLLLSSSSPRPSGLGEARRWHDLYFRVLAL
eukprot:4817393-Pyramimonas_sp.AAC.1